MQKWLEEIGLLKKDAVSHKAETAALAARVSTLENDVKALQSELSRLRTGEVSQQISAPVEDIPVWTATPEPQAIELASPVPEIAEVEQVPVAAFEAGHSAKIVAPAVFEPAKPTWPPAEPPPPSLVERGIAAARDWLLGGNSVVRVGILILFFGVAFLLKYAADNDLLPIEFRIAGVCVGAVALLVLGWRLREKRASYALALQGAGIGVLYLTVFAATKLYQLVPSAAAFPLLVAICALAAGLAVLQNALVLAFTGSVGGFLAPVLISSGGGSHVALFSYYTVLNAGIFAVAWYKAWRPLNLLGFVFTFGIGSAWGFLSYEPEKLLTTEPFLILFFLMYTAIALLYALRRQVNLKHYVDGTLVFGTPLVAMAIQARLMQDVPFGMAFSAVAMAAFYLGLSLWLVRHRERLGLLFESMLALGVIFATLAVPLAFDGQTTSAVWALEGAAIVWVSIRQQHRNGLFCGILLQIAAGVMFAIGMAQDVTPALLPILNSRYIGTLLLALSGLFSGWLLQGRPEARAWFPPSAELGLGAAIWGLSWWIGGGVFEIYYWNGIHQHNFLLTALEQRARIAWLALFAVLTAWLALGVRYKLAWPLARLPALMLAPVLAVLALTSCLLWAPSPLAWPGLAVWPIAFGSAYLMLWRQQGFHRKDVLAPLHTVLFLTLCVLFSSEGFWRLRAYVPEGAWSWSAWAYAYGSLLAMLSAWGWKLRWPVLRFMRAYMWWGALPLAVLLWGWSLGSLISDGTAAPLPYVPLLNPIDIAQLLVFLAIGLWLQRIRASGFQFAPYVALATAFLWLNAVLLRTLHHHFGISYDVFEIVRSFNLQLIFITGWGVMALVGMYWARGQKMLKLFTYASAPVVLVMCLWTFITNLTQGGTLLGHIPLINPLDLVVALAYGVALFWLTRAPCAGIAVEPHLKTIKAVAAITLLLWLNAMLLRTLHHWADIPYTLTALSGSTLVQASLSVFWTVLALVIMVVATRRSMRTLWLIGGALLAVTVAKLFLFDLSFVKGIERIFSFIGVGLLLLLIGYFSPLPPKAKEAA